MTLRITVLGSSGTFATRSRAASGYLLEVDGARLWLDAGAGTWRNLLGSASYADIDGVLLTHRHPDHTSDVFQAMHARLYGGPGPLAPIPLWAPAETLERVCSFAPEIGEAFELGTIAAGGSLTVGRASLKFVPMAHPPETVGVRLQHEGGIFAYSADTGPNADFRALAGDADLFLCEATLQEEDEGWEGHMTAAAAATAAEEVGAKRLLLTHLPPDRDVALSLKQARSAAMDLAVELAEDGMTVEVGR